MKLIKSWTPSIGIALYMLARIPPIALCPELDKLFVQGALNENLLALKGHRAIGGIRASIYNSMSMEGVEALVSFMFDFEKKSG